MNEEFKKGVKYTLANLLSIDQALAAVNLLLTAEGRKPISKRRMQALARHRHDRDGVGRQLNGNGSWVFIPDEIKDLVPGNTGKPQLKK